MPARVCDHVRVHPASTRAALAPASETLFARHLRFDAADHLWPDRDRLLVGHGAADLAYGLCALVGADPMLATTLPGAAGQILGTAVGMALAERMLAARFGRSLVDHRIWVLCDADELATGAAFEAASVAGELLLGRLAVIVAQGGGLASTWRRFVSQGWGLRLADAADPAGEAALSAALRSRKPTLIVCDQAAPTAFVPAAARLPAGAGAGSDSAAHNAVRDWAAIGRRAAGARRAWLKRLRRHTGREAFEQAAGGHGLSRWPGDVAAAVPVHRESAGRENGAPPAGCRSTAAAMRLALGRLAETGRSGGAMPELAGLPVEDACGLAAMMPGQYGGRSIDWGARSQAAAAGLNGMALHGGVLPVGRFLLGDAEATRPSLRVAAQLGLRVVHLLIEPPAPCPVAGLRAGWRAMRNLHVHRPANLRETWVCGELAFRRAAGPSVLLLSEAETETAMKRSTEPGHEERSASVRGGYLAYEPAAERDVTLVASGSELAVALQAQKRLQAAGIAAAVVSLPCWDLFHTQPAVWRDTILGAAPRVAIEAGGGFGWDRWLGPAGLFIGCRADGIAVSADDVAAAVQRHLASLSRAECLDNSARLVESRTMIR